MMTSLMTLNALRKSSRDTDFSLGTGGNITAKTKFYRVLVIAETYCKHIKQKL